MLSIGKSVQLRSKASQAFREMDHRDLGRSGFWLSQFFIIIATIVGVYLAANAGLKQAITFDNLTGHERNYYLRVSLHDEVQDNVTRLRAYVDETLSRNPSQAVLQNQRPELQQFVWETMRFSPRTLETPSIFLTGGRRFYSEAQDIITKAERRTYGATHAAGLMTALLDQMEQDYLPRLQANYEALGDYLQAQGMIIDIIKE
ncbi:MAG: hypothetical protein LAT63_15670 [Marinobacter sp.]|nr:hypothetical protein [Marinobacter sp.]